MATVPLSGTDIRLLSGVPFSNDYKNTRWFDTSTDQMAYFDSKPIVHTLAEYNFQRIEGYHYIAVNKSIDELWNANYIMFRNTAYGNKWFFAFITKLEYKQRNNTYVHFQIDVFQTWKFEMDFKPSYVVREHRPLWKEDGTPVLNTVDEGLNYGSDYDTVSVEKLVPYNDVFFLVMVTKTLLHDRADGKAKDYLPIINGSPQPLCYYIHPFKLDGTSPYAMINGEEAVLSKPTDVLKYLYQFKDAVNNLVSLYVTDYIGINFPLTELGEITIPPEMFDNITMMETIEENGQPVQKYFNTLFLKEVKQYTPRVVDKGNKWLGYESVAESKLMMYPYTQLILDDFKGNRVTFKNEYINHPDLHIQIKGSLGTSNKVSYSLPDYNFSATSHIDEVSGENALINNDPNDIPIITDMLAAYLQGNRNSISNQQSSIIFNGVMNGISGVTSAVTGAASGAIGGSMLGPAGAIAGGVSGAMGGVMNTVQGAGNAVLQMQGIQAKQKDINNVPPSIAKMGSNTAYSTGNGYNGIYIIKKQIKPEYRTKLSYFFKMFGYKLNEVKIPNFHTREHFNYVQTSNCIITGNFNHDDLNELKSIFDNGITLWHTDDVGNYSLENGVI
jgi:Caudoviral major tail protein N-terminus